MENQLLLSMIAIMYYSYGILYFLFKLVCVATNSNLCK